MIKDENHIDSIIARYVANNASDEDLFLLQEWMDQSEDNKRYVENVRLLYDKATPYIKVDTLKAWGKVKSQLNAPHFEKAVPIRKKPIFILQKSSLRVAAIFALLLSIASLFHYLLTPSDSDFVSYNIASANTSINKTIGNNIKVCLNRETTISVVENKKNKTKELKLSGEAFIQVKHSSDEQLIVKAEETMIKDIGTAFNVKAHPGSSTIEVYVEEGEVSFFTKDLNGISVCKGETGIFDKQTKHFRKLTIYNPNVNAYKTRKFIFVNTPLSEAVKEINTVYPNSILLEDSVIGNSTITVTFENEKIDDIAAIMSETLGLHISKSPKGYILH